MKLLLILTLTFSISSIFAAKKIKNLSKDVAGINKLIKVTGSTTGFDSSIERRMDGHIDFALIMPSLTVDKILNFSLSDVISPKSDNVDLVGYQFGIPSNFALPKQKEAYVRTLKLNKPQVRVFVPKSGSYPVSTIHGKFKVKKVVDKIFDGKPIFDLLNDFKFIGGGQLPVNTKNSNNSFDVNKFKFKGKALINAPTYDKNSLTLFSVPMESINGYLHLTDLKYIDSGSSIKVTTSKNNPMFSLNILTDKIEQYDDPFFKGGVNEDGEPIPQEYLYEAQFNRSTLSFMPLTTKKHTPLFLDLIPAPQLNGSQLLLSAPKNINKINPLATIVELVASQKFKNGKLVSEHKKSLWKTVKSGWVTSVSLPNKSLPAKKGVTYKYEVSFVATSDLNYTPSAKSIDLNKFSLITKNYLVIK